MNNQAAYFFRLLRVSLADFLPGLSAATVLIPVPPGLAAFSDNVLAVVDVSAWFTDLDAARDRLWFSNHGYPGDGAPIVMHYEITGPAEITVGLVNVDLIVTTAGNLTVEVLRQRS